MSKYLVAKKFFENSNNNLPYDAEIEYLEGDGTQYISTGLKINNYSGYQVELKYKFVTKPSSESWVFGYWNYIPSNRLYLIGFYNNQLRCGAGPDNSSYHCNIAYDSDYHIAEIKNDGSYFDGTKLCETDLNMLGENTNSILIFKSPHIDTGGIRRITYCKLWSLDNELVQDLIPVRKGTTGYMYDKVSGQLFENIGSENFILGPDTKVIEPEIPEENQPSSKFIVGKRFTDITDFVNPNFSSIKKYFETKFQLNFDTDGGNILESKTVVLGKQYGDLPIPTKAQNIFIGWFTSASGGVQITSESITSLDINILYARWEYVQINFSNCTSYSVTTNSSYRNTGIYTASISNSSQPIYIDWGDGTVEKTTSSISQKSHTYKTNGNFIVKISDNITSFAPSYNSSTWYGTTSQNRYTFKGMISTGSKVTSLPAYAFYYCSAMINIDFMETCYPTVVSLPSYCFYYCSGLTSIQGAKRFTSLGSYCFQYCTGLSGIQDLSEFKFTTLPNSYTFANCTNVTQWILPDGFTGTSFGSYMFSNNTKLSSLVLPNSLTSTGTYAFYNCSNLNNIIIPSNVQSIGNSTFYGCTSLNNVNIEATNLTAINQYAFYNCNKLTDLDLPNTVKTIGDYAFYGCTNLDYAGHMANDLPYDAEIEYLESDGTQYINTGVILNNDFGISIKFAPTEEASSVIEHGVFGSSVSNAAIHNVLQIHHNSTNGAGVGLWMPSTTCIAICPTILGTYQHWEINLENSGDVVVDGVLMGSTQPTIASNCPYPVYLFARNVANTIKNNSFSSMRLALWRVYNGVGNLVQDAIPVRVGNVGYMYDKVSGQLFGNLGTGNFILGPDIKTTSQQSEFPSQLTSIGSYAYQGCSNLKSLNIPENLQTIGDYAFAGCYQISSIVDKRLIAQTVSTNTFGSATGTSNTAFTGYQTKGNNIFSTYFSATGYDENAWDDPLQNPDKCGFIQQYIDPENIVYHTVTFDAGIGNISEITRSIIKGKKIGELPTPRCPVDTPYFGGWFTSINGTGTKVSKDYRITSDITFYALYSTVPFTVCNIDLNNQWRASSKANPDSSLYDGPYESNSNYNIGNAYSKMYIRISGYSTFNVYIRSYAESSYDYVVAMNLDVDVTSNPSSGTSGVKAHTSGKQNSGTAIGNYTKVEYTDIPDGEHFICIVYRKDGSVNENDDRGYVLIDKQDVASTDSRSIFLVDDVGILYDEDKQLMIASERIYN